MDRVEDMQSLARQQWEKRARALGLNINTSAKMPAEEDNSQ
jgi:hypothetical protein